MIKLHMDGKPIWIRKDSIVYFFSNDAGCTWVSLINGRAFVVDETFEAFEDKMIRG